MATALPLLKAVTRSEALGLAQGVGKQALPEGLSMSTLLVLSFLLYFSTIILLQNKSFPVFKIFSIYPSKFLNQAIPSFTKHDYICQKK